jgi:lipoprotein-anchoring transpeptidase ErfK/SrfK
VRRSIVGSVAALVLVALVAVEYGSRERARAGPGPRLVRIDLETRPSVIRIATPFLGTNRPRRRAHHRHPRTELLAHVTHPMAIRLRPGAGRVIGTMPVGSRYYHQPIVAWVLRLSKSGRYGKVPVPYSGVNRAGWIDLRGLRLTRSKVRVEAVLSRHLLEVERGSHVLFHATAATGSPATPTPPGRYFVTDRVPFSPGSEYGMFAFGISGIQTHLPPGWTAGDQLAIHGTNEPWSIGRSVSTGCLRVSAFALQRMKPLLRPGTPVVISP